ncbi:MAG: nucleoside triphosphate pyrophosphohydrolase [Ruminococcaceae bacterium]|nr:nucleoside triphosphate pyrophosphohydrolase [Oscillospiraceae bacterium]
MQKKSLKHLQLKEKYSIIIKVVKHYLYAIFQKASATVSVDFEIKDRYTYEDLLKIITALRAPDGCPWDREQTHESIKSNFIEETYEVIEAINKNSPEMMREELGDVLLQVALHAEMESEKGNFDFDDVIHDIVYKLVIRHPHVFGDVKAENGEEALASWDNAKEKSKGGRTASEAIDSIPRELPALMRAQKVQKKAAKAGFDWDNCDGAFDKLDEEIKELKIAMEHGDKAEIEDEFGDVLFSAVNISRFLKVDSEEALTGATEKFIARFKEVERLAAESGTDMKDASIEELDKLWDKAKKINNTI